MTSMAAYAGVGAGARMANFVFGSPNVRRANGLRPGLPAGAKRRGVRTLKAASVPVFAVDYPARCGSWGLPRVWMSEPSYDEALGCAKGRELTGCYPQGPDVSGLRALGHAQAYFAEALRYVREEDRILRRECFRAAELLYLHAAARGSVQAALKLGCIYEADLCEGLYWGWCSGERGFCRMGALVLQAQAFERFSFAAVRGSAEGCWHLGDMVSDGRGCPAHPQGALALYQRAFDLAEGAGDIEAAGNAALRLGRAFEEGLGHARNLKKALGWYRIAAECLERALALGAWHYKKPCHQARVGARRVQQELIGRY